MERLALDSAHAKELLRRQSLLQAEARRVIVELDLMHRLGGLGEVEEIGSSVSGLMVRRDLDFSVRGSQPTVEGVFESLLPIITHERVHEVVYRLETGARSPSGRPEDERYYLVIRFEAEDEQAWKIDISVWLSDAPRNYSNQLNELARRLTDETRLAILWIKDVWHRLAEYPAEVSGTDIYAAVLDHDVRSPSEFGRYLERRGLKGSNLNEPDGE